MRGNGHMDFRHFLWFFLLAFYVLDFYHKFASAVPPQICIADSLNNSRKTDQICESIGKLSKYRVECFMEKDRFNCLRRLTTGDADATVLYPENLLAAAAYSEFDILVTNELRLFQNLDQEFQMVAVAQKHVRGLSDIRGRTFCHPGSEPTDEWSSVFNTYFENWVVFRECNYDKTLLENKIDGLSKFFKAACIAGPWTVDPVLDGRLKSKYKNLCALCENPVGCHTSDKYHGREGALLCLTDNVGDIAWARLDDTLEHFERENIDKADFNYICPDGTKRPLGFGEPCIWISRPWPVVVSRREMAERVANLITGLKTPQASWQRNLSLLLENYKVIPVSVDNMETPDDFLRRFPGFVSANTRTQCRPSRTVRWCVTSDIEEQKCQWIRQAAYSYGVEPSISCVREPSRQQCLEAVKSERAAIFVAKPEEMLEARKKGLKSLLHITTKKQKSIDGIVALVKRESYMEKLTDAKGAKACFTGYQSIGWNSFHSTMRNLSEGEWDCTDVVAIGNFFKAACVPDFTNKERRKSLPHPPPSNLYSLCDDGVVAGDDASTFHCLESGIADVVFVNLKNLVNATGGYVVDRNFLLKNDIYKALCIVEDPSGNERTCLLAWTTLGSVVVNENMTDVRREEIYAFLLELDHIFGRFFHGRAPTLSLYDEYDGKTNIIFPEEAQHLQLPDGGFQQPGARSYDEVVEDLAKDALLDCTPSKAISLLNTQIQINVILCIFASLVSRLLICTL